MIVVKELSLKIKSAQILSEINLEMDYGNIYGLVGRNGSGKTMLMKCICGFVYPSCGTVEVDGKYVGKDMDFPQNMGVIIENPEFIPYMSGFENLQILARCRRIIDAEEIRKVMRTVGLEPDSRLHVRKYSLGMRQRLGLAQAIMENPSILILDEPMNGLDSAGVKEMRSLLLMLREQGKLVLLASHSEEDIRILCDVAYRMERGRILPGEELYS